MQSFYRGKRYACSPQSCGERPAIFHPGWSGMQCSILGVRHAFPPSCGERHAILPFCDVRHAVLPSCGVKHAVFLIQGEACSSSILRVRHAVFLIQGKVYRPSLLRVKQAVFLIQGEACSLPSCRLGMQSFSFRASHAVFHPAG
jgi:hypothetical protein